MWETWEIAGGGEINRTSDLPKGPEHCAAGECRVRSVSSAPWSVLFGAKESGCTPTVSADQNEIRTENHLPCFSNSINLHVYRIVQVQQARLHHGLQIILRCCQKLEQHSTHYLKGWLTFLDPGFLQGAVHTFSSLIKREIWKTL